MKSLCLIEYRIICVSDGGTRFVFESGLSYVDAFKMCNDVYNWEWMDENGFCWSLEIEPDR